ncbi:hypothetical protein [Coleofasciculus sp.]|uniref:hypothetical protein n=1 Tax=Coleofasciculus sp. TaxID=3100458 RepID=UPI0039F74A72
MITFSLEPNSVSASKPWKLQIWLSPKSQAIYYLHDPQQAQSILEFILAKNNSQIKEQGELSFAGLIPRSLASHQPFQANACVC